MILHTARFGEFEIGDEEIITIPQGILGFPQFTRYALVDPGDDALILWLQSVDEPTLAFPVLEPKIFYPTYTVKLTPTELRDLKLESVNQSVVFSILTIPEDVHSMSANLKAPVVINLREQVGRQVVLQENDYVIKYPMFKELRTHLIAISAPRNQGEAEAPSRAISVVKIPEIPPSLSVKSV